MNLSHRILSSTAERAYWLGRYLERADSTARLVTVYSRLLFDLPKRLPLAWQGLVNISGSRTLFDEHFSEADEKHVCRHLINDARNSGSLIRSLDFARENVRTLRGIIPRKSVEYINDLHLFTRDRLSEPLSRTRRVEGLQEVQTYIQRIDGFLSANMLHDAHWTFLRLGNYIERADMTSRILEAGCDDIFDDASELDPFTDIQWRSVLLSLDATQAYNQVVQGPVSQEAVLNFLVHETRLPRSMAYPLDSLRHSIRDLPRNERPMRLINRLRRQTASTEVGRMSIEAIRKFLDDFQRDLVELDSLISRTYFHYRPRRRRAAG
ncbi:MAG: alpha-E domain-containing protein [Pseudomonadales bacterium]